MALAADTRLALVPATTAGKPTDCEDHELRLEYYPRRQLHVVLDNYATHKHVKVQAWPARRPRIQLHFTPTYASCLNLVEVFFATIERQALRRGDFASVEELMAAIRRSCDGWNQRCRPFTWTKDADQILTKLQRQTLQQRTTRGCLKSPYDPRLF